MAGLLRWPTVRARFLCCSVMGAPAGYGLPDALGGTAIALRPLIPTPYDNGRRGPCRILNGASGAAGLERSRSSRTAGRTGSTAASPRRSFSVDHARRRPGGCDGARKEATPRPGPAREDRSLTVGTRPLPGRPAQSHAVTITRPRRRPRSVGECRSPRTSPT